jgi:hypothetical protein
MNVWDLAKFFPGIQRGHGSLRKGKCLRPGCKCTDRLHKQNPAKQAERWLNRYYGQDNGHVRRKPLKFEFHEED